MEREPSLTWTPMFPGSRSWRWRAQFVCPHGRTEGLYVDRTGAPSEEETIQDILFRHEHSYSCGCAAWWDQQRPAPDSGLPGPPEAPGA